MSRIAPQRSDPLELKLARFLGWFSLGLGAPQLTRPDLVNRAIGVRDDRKSRFWQRVVGVREIVAWAGLIGRRWPVEFAWSRVAGDIKDLALLGSAYRNKRESTPRLTGAIASVVGITALDAYTAVRLTQNRGRTRREEGPMQLKAAITVRQPLADVFAVWERFENLPTFMEHLRSVSQKAGGRSHWTANAPGGGTIEWDAEVIEITPNELIAWRSLPNSDIDCSGRVRFVPAPGLRGSEVHVELEYHVPGGKLGKAVANLLGEDPQQQVKDDLRRFKQLVEAGEVVRSEATPEGTGARGFVKQRPARPLEDQPEPAAAAAAGRAS